MIVDGYHRVLERCSSRVKPTRKGSRLRKNRENGIFIIDIRVILNRGRKRRESPNHADLLIMSRVLSNPYRLGVKCIGMVEVHAKIFI